MLKTLIAFVFLLLMIPLPAHAKKHETGFLDRTTNIGISEEHHGPPDARRYNYMPTYILRGLTRLHLELTPAQPAA